VMEESPISVSCRGNAHVTAGIEDVTNICLNFRGGTFATIHNSWLAPRKVREMTLVCSRRMIIYDDTEPLEKLKIYDTRVEAPPHYDSFAEFTYSYHYGDAYVPYIKQDEPLKLECQHFLECIRDGRAPITSGRHGLEVVRILEAAGFSLRQHGAGVFLDVPAPSRNGDRRVDGNGTGAKAQGNGNVQTSANGNGNAEIIIPTAGRNVSAV